jgi:hypothetical protein
MMEAVKSENEQAEMPLIAMAFYPAKGLYKRELPRNEEELDPQPLPEGCGSYR